MATTLSPSWPPALIVNGHFSTPLSSIMPIIDDTIQAEQAGHAHNARHNVLLEALRRARDCARVVGVEHAPQDPCVQHHVFFPAPLPAFLRAASDFPIIAIPSITPVSPANSSTHTMGIAAKKKLNSGGARLPPCRKPWPTLIQSDIGFRRLFARAPSCRRGICGHDRQHRGGHAEASEHAPQQFPVYRVVGLGEVGEEHAKAEVPLFLAQLVEPLNDEQHVERRAARAEASLLLRKDAPSLVVAYFYTYFEVHMYIHTSVGVISPLRASYMPLFIFAHISDHLDYRLSHSTRLLRLLTTYVLPRAFPHKATQLYPHRVHVAFVG